VRHLRHALARRRPGPPRQLPEPRRAGHPRGRVLRAQPRPHAHARPL